MWVHGGVVQPVLSVYDPPLSPGSEAVFPSVAVSVSVSVPRTHGVCVQVADVDSDAFTALTVKHSGFGSEVFDTGGSVEPSSS